MRSRRGFLKALAVAPVVPGALGPQSPAPGVAAATAGASASIEEALTEAIRLQYGAHLDAAELEEVRKELVRNRAAAGRLRAAARLVNADDLATRFEARPPAPAPADRGAAR
jgi:hypothetical protein